MVSPALGFAPGPAPTLPTNAGGAMAQSQAVPVRVLDANNNPLAGRTVTLVSSNPAVVSVPASVVSDANGNASYLATAQGLGSCDVTETSEGKSATTHFEVGSSQTVASVQVHALRNHPGTSPARSLFPAKIPCPIQSQR